MKLNENFKKMRESKRISARSLSKMANVNTATITRFEQDQTDIKLSNLCSLLDCMGFDLSDLEVPMLSLNVWGNMPKFTETNYKYLMPCTPLFSLDDENKMFAFFNQKTSELFAVHKTMDVGAGDQVLVLDDETEKCSMQRYSSVMDKKSIIGVIVELLDSRHTLA